MPRPTKLTPELQEGILSLIRKGNYIETACIASGITKKTYYTWLERGRNEEEPYAAFLDATEEARKEAEQMLLQCIADASKRDVMGDKADWKAGAWILERTRPQDYSRKQVMEHKGEGQQVRVQLESVPKDLQKDKGEGDA